MKYLIILQGGFIVLRILDNILSRFHSVFTYDAAFNWFVIVIIGFIVRFDHMGISSFIRWLYLDPVHYDALLLFFRTSSWTLDNLLVRWISMAITLFPMIQCENSSNLRKFYGNRAAIFLKFAKIIPHSHTFSLRSRLSKQALSFWFS